MTKTCQNCKHYIAEMFHCQKNDVMAEAFNTCEDFEPKVITNGDRIRQGGDDALVEFKKKHKCDCCVYICNGNCTEPVDRKNRCDDGLKHWLNAPAESEGKMSKMCKNCRYFATTGSSSVCTLYCKRPTG